VIGTFVGNFEIVSPLGKGGMGEVWLANHRAMNTKVAIKILAAEVSTNTTHVQRFRNEVVAVSNIPHSGIVRMFDTGDLPDGRAYLVMEYLQGETLTSRIRRMGRLELPLIADFGRQIASVLDATHGAGITHRDLKPDNIYLVRDAEMPHGERIKILDFGIAKLDTTVGPRMTAASVSSIGTPNYMSPEQWHSLADVDWRTDAYALGCVAFEMACGKPPFVAQTRVEVCAMHLGEPPPIPSTRVVGLPVAFDQLVGKLLEKTPTDRPTMREVIDAFTTLGYQHGVSLRSLAGGVSPFAAAPASSMQYKSTPHQASDSLRYGETPASGSQLASRIAASGSRADDTPISSMSLQFKPTPVAGFESQSAMRAQTDPASSQPVMAGATGELAADRRGSQPRLGARTRRSRWPWLVLVGLAVAAGIAVAMVVGGGGPSGTGASGDLGTDPARGSATGSAPNHAVEAGSEVAIGSGGASGSASNSGSDAAATGSGSDVAGSALATGTRRKRIPELPPLRHAVKQPTVVAALPLEVCIDAEGSVDSIERVDGAILPKLIEAIVSTWEYKPYEEAGVAIPVCGPVTLEARKQPPAPRQDTRPERLSPKMITDGLAQVQDKVIDCDVGEVDATFRVTVNVKKNGSVTLVKLNPEPPPLRTLVACIKRAVASARFTPTRTDNTLTTTVRFGR